MDLGLAFALLPLWWVLGIDQLVWLPLALFILLKRRFVEKRLRVERVALVLLLAFGVSFLLSGSTAPRSSVRGLTGCSRSCPTS